MSFETVSVIGLGYIGLPTAAAFAARRKSVIGVDVSQHAVDTINRGQIHIVEPELDMLVHAAVTQGHLRATTSPEPADAFLIAVPTPFTDGNKPDLSYIEAACRSIAPVLKKGDLVVLESTSPVGATERMAAWLAAQRPDLTFPQQAGERSDIRIAHCPERVLPGHVVRELVENDRVIGGMTRKCGTRAQELYAVFVRGECILTDARTAEMCKLTENSFRDVNIAFANELSVICDQLDINVWELIRLANRHPRVSVLQPGPGVGGHCIAVDPWFIVDSAPEHARLIRTAR
ncbi:UDP-N-acetyl-D-mannosamine dehydrogenase, partial [Burkholderia cenocepacia]